MKKIGAGLTFAALWGSGSVATKIGIKTAQPLLLINVRFVLAALLMLFISLLVNKDRLPKRNEWRSLIICGVLSKVDHIHRTQINSLNLSLTFIVSLFRRKVKRTVLPIFDWNLLFIALNVKKRLGKPLIFVISSPARTPAS